MTRREPEPARLLLKISIVIEPDEGGFHGYAPALKGLHVDGATKEEALDNAKIAVEIYLKSLTSHNDPLPIGPDLTVHREVIVQREVIPEIPIGAFLHHLTVQWPSLNISGNR